MTTPRILIMHAPGTNRDREAALACTAAGGTPEIVHMNRLLSGERRLADYQMIVIPGGFSFGDDLGAGRLWAIDLSLRLRETAQTVANFLQFGLMILCANFFPFSALPPWVVNIANFFNFSFSLASTVRIAGAINPARFDSE